MKVNSPYRKAGLGSSRAESAASRVPLIVALVVIAVVCGAVMFFRTSRPPAPQPPPAPQNTTTAVTSRATAAPIDPRQLVATLARIDLTGITPEKAAAWKQTWQQLTEQGSSAVPAIREFLDRQENLNFESIADGATLLGHPTLRLALLAALHRLGGAEATAALAQTLRTTTDPREIAALAHHLEAAAPGQYVPAVLDAARHSLALAAEGKLEGQDTGPLFGVFQHWGGTNVLTDLTNALPQWKYYAGITLANLPDGGGVPALVQLASDPEVAKATQGVVLQMLAQIAARYPAARTALVEQARASQIPEPTWVEVASVLGGHSFQIGNPSADAIPSSPGGGNVKRYHLAFGNQNFYSAQNAVSLPAGEINERLAIVDQLLATTSNAIAGEVLGKARAALLSRLPP